jgi:hypothetical protein
MSSKIKTLIISIWNLKMIQMFIPDKLAINVLYRIRMKKKLNLKQPITFNEKLQWLKLYDRRPTYGLLVDKYDVRQYICETIGTEYLVPLLGVWDNFDDIDFANLPNQFVLKCTHDSGGVVICKDKHNFDIEAAKIKINKSFKNNFYYVGREWPYKNLKPRIIAEVYMVDESGTELKDYKIFTFKSKAKLIQVDFDRYNGHKRNLYTTDWEFIDAEIEYPSNKDVNIKRPKKLLEMINLSEKLSEGIPHVRIDFYSIDDKVYFGEMTFYHGSGLERFYPEKLNIQMGDWIELPENVTI